MHPKAFLMLPITDILYLDGLKRTIVLRHRYGVLFLNLLTYTVKNARGWAGVQTLPRQVSLNSDLTISQIPINELSVLHGTEYTYDNLIIDDKV